MDGGANAWLSQCIDQLRAALAKALLGSCAATSHVRTLQQLRGHWDEVHAEFMNEVRLPKDQRDEEKLQKLEARLKGIEPRITELAILADEEAKEGADYYWELAQRITTFIVVGAGAAISASQ